MQLHLDLLFLEKKLKIGFLCYVSIVKIVKDDNCIIKQMD